MNKPPPFRLLVQRIIMIKVCRPVPLTSKWGQVRPQKLRSRIPLLAVRDKGSMSKVLYIKVTKLHLLCFRAALILLLLQHQLPKPLVSIMSHKQRMKESEKLNLSMNKKK